MAASSTDPRALTRVTNPVKCARAHVTRSDAYFFASLAHAPDAHRALRTQSYFFALLAHAPDAHRALRTQSANTN